MNLYVQLGLVGGMLMLKPDQFPTKESNPELLRVLSTLGVSDIASGDLTAIRQRYLDVLATLESQFDYYDQDDLFINNGVNAYLEELFGEYEQRKFEMPKQVAIRLCALGNRAGEENESSGVAMFIGELQTLLNKMEAYADEFPNAWTDFQLGLKSMEYVDNVLDIVNTFVMAKAGMLAGVEEFPPIDKTNLKPIGPSDFTVEECTGEESCECGCKPDHALTLLQGLEDYLEGKDTYECRYTMGVAAANSIKLDNVAGNEGPVLDKLKAMTTKAYDAVVESLKALNDLVSTSEDKAKGEASTEDADNNKKALQGMQDKTLQINAKAKVGLNNLANKTYPDGSMRKLTDSLKIASDAPGVIDALLGLMQKELGGSGELNTARANADKAVQDLKTTMDKSSSVDEKNKDVTDSYRTDVKDKMTYAQATFKDAKAKIKAHNIKISGIQKAIKGISPFIFPDLDKPEEKEAQKEKNTDAAAAAKAKK